VFRGVQREPLVLVLPAYQRPHVATIAKSVANRVWAFASKAGRIIVLTLTVVWLLMSIPAVAGHPVGDVPVQDSVYGRVAEGVAPAFAPAGMADWHVTAALATGFVAKEVVVGSLAQSYAVTETTGSAQSHELGAGLRATLDATSGGHGGAAAMAFMVFVLGYTPCVAALAEQRRRFGVRWTASAVGVQLAVAWLLAVGVFQVGRLL
jgi:ferrous iron transport protein B